MTANGTVRSAEWGLFEEYAGDLRRMLSRTLRRELVHDARSAAARVQNLPVADLADEAIAWALENWKAKPHATTPEAWVRKHALQLLDELLDGEALAAESRAEERDAERRGLAHELLEDAHDEERADWLDMADLALRSRRQARPSPDDEPMDSLESDPQVSSPEQRLGERETIVRLERALLRLPEMRRKVVAHRFLDGLAVEEIAYLVDEPTKAVEQEIAAGLRDLQADMAPA
jgi:DNA-directed RNA polymerase specialized sigma24 family protein